MRERELGLIHRGGLEPRKVGRPRKNPAGPDTTRYPGRPKVPTLPLRIQAAIDETTHLIRYARRRCSLPLQAAQEILEHRLWLYRKEYVRVLLKCVHGKVLEPADYQQLLTLGDEVMGVVAVSLPYTSPRLQSISLSSDPDNPPPAQVVNNVVHQVVMPNDPSEAMKEYLAIVQQIEPPLAVTTVEEPPHDDDDQAPVS